MSNIVLRNIANLPILRLPEPPTAAMAALDPAIAARRPIRVGLLICGFFFFGFGGWATFWDLQSAAVSPGVVAVDSRKQTVQHLEGGIIDQILVEEGSAVEEGQVLIRLDRTRAKANADLVRGQYLQAIGEKARLMAERDKKDNVEFPAELTEEPQSDQAREVINNQTQMFKSRGDYVVGQKEILEQRRKQLLEEINASTAQQTAAGQQLALIKQEIAGVVELVDKGLERRPRLLQLQRAAADITGNQGEYKGRIARSQQQIGEIQSQLNDLGNKSANEVATSLRDVESKIYDASQKLLAANDVFKRLEIVSPRRGEVVNMRFHTPGGVIGAGQPIMDIVPKDDELVIESQVRPTDINNIVVGMPAQVRLVSYNRRSVPVVSATLLTISADALSDQKTGQSYYLARVKVDADELHHLKEVRLVPGMPAEVMLLTGHRTPINYLLSPITSSFSKAFREQ
jgi:HlyD family type I secretion membrane fusion protein